MGTRGGVLGVWKVVICECCFSDIKFAITYIFRTDCPYAHTYCITKLRDNLSSHARWYCAAIRLS